MEENIWQRIYNSSINFLVPQDTEEVYQLIVKEAIKLVGANYGSIFVVQNNKPIRVYSSYSKLYGVEARPGGKTYQVYQNSTPYLVSSEDESDHPEFKKLGIKSGIGIPLIYGHITIGVLSVLSKKENLTQTEIEHLLLFAPLATLAVRKAYLTNELNKAIESRDLFMSLAAHELKTPLTVLSAYTELLLRNPDKTTRLKYINKINNELHRIKNLVNEFLYIDSSNKGQLKYLMKKINIYDLVGETIENTSNANKSHKFIYNTKPSKFQFIYADPEKISQVILNILNNAIKFSPVKTAIRISLIFHDSKFHIKVSDQGPGIPPQDLHSIFERFYRGSSDKPGMGLGLYLSKQIVQKHKGNISIKSKLKKGTIVTISLPAMQKNSHARN